MITYFFVKFNTKDLEFEKLKFIQNKILNIMNYNEVDK